MSTKLITKFYSSVFFLICTILLLKAQNFELNNSFGNAGIVMTDFSSEFPENTVQASIMDSINLPEKKYYAAFSDQVYRLNADKTLDTSFGINGIADVSYFSDKYNSSGGNITQIVAQPEGNVLVQIRFDYTPSFDEYRSDELLLQLDNQGNIRSEFGNNGVILNKESTGYNIKLNDNGFYYYGLISNSINCYYYSPFVYKYTKDGKPVQGFTPIHPKSVKSFHETIDVSYFFHIKNDGKIIIVRDATIYDYDYYPHFKGVYQFLSDGKIDTSFGLNGEVVFEFQEELNFTEIKVNELTQIELISNSLNFNSGVYKPELLTLNANGILISRTPLPNYKPNWNNPIKLEKVSVLKKSINKILHTHQFDNGKLLSVGSSNNKFVISRYTSNGQLDLTFHDKGYRVDKNLDTPTQVHFLTNHFLVLFTSGKLKKYTFDGNEISSFVYNDPQAKSFKVLADGSIIVGKKTLEQIQGTYNDKVKVTIVRLSSGGVQDTSFVINEEYLSNSCNPSELHIFGVINNQTIITFNSEEDKLRKYNSNTGQLISTTISPDLDFGRPSFLPDCPGKFFKSMDLTSEGKIILRSYIQKPSSDGSESYDHYLLERFNSDGTKDDTFNVIKRDFIYTYQILDDGSILTGGKNIKDNLASYLVEKHLSSGVVDTTFGTDGKVEIPQFADEQQISNIILKENGGIIISGITNDNFNLIELQEKEVLSTEVISTNKEENSYSISPNPITDFAELISLTSTNSIEKIQVFNLFGGLVKTIHVNHEQRVTGLEDRIQLNLSELQQGIYLLKVIDTKNKVTTIKAIKK